MPDTVLLRVPRYLHLTVAILSVFSLSSCMVLRTSERGYYPTRFVSDGTAFEGEMLAEGCDTSFALSAMVVAAGAAGIHEPYRLQITAYGIPGKHLTFEIKEIRALSDGGKKLVLREGDIGGSPLFVGGDWKGEVVSARTAKGLIPWKSQEEGRIRIEADIIIGVDAGERRGTLKFIFEPRKDARVETAVIPWEIKKAIWKESREPPITAWENGTSSP